MENLPSSDCPDPGPGQAERPFSPLGWSARRRLMLALAACLLLWAAVLWALD